MCARICIGRKGGTHVKVKICGLCRAQDAAAAARAGADYAGVILAAGFQRTQSVPSAADIYAAAGTLARVGVFVNPEAHDVVQIAETLGLDVVQLHGDENVDLVAGIRTSGCEIWKTVWLRTADDLIEAIDAYGSAVDGLLLDAKRDGKVGGTGVRFDWSLAAAARRAVPANLQVIVAGGLTPANVREAVELLVPDVVDVASGVESVPGQKSEAAITAFVRNARL